MKSDVLRSLHLESTIKSQKSQCKCKPNSLTIQTGIGYALDRANIPLSVVRQGDTPAPSVTRTYLRSGELKEDRLGKRFSPGTKWGRVRRGQKRLVRSVVFVVPEEHLDACASVLESADSERTIRAKVAGNPVTSSAEFPALPPDSLGVASSGDYLVTR